MPMEGNTVELEQKEEAAKKSSVEDDTSLDMASMPACAATRDADETEQIKQCSLFDAAHFQLDRNPNPIPLEQIGEAAPKRRRTADGNSYTKAYMPSYAMTRDIDETEQLKQSSLFDVVHCQKKLFLVLDLDHTLLNSSTSATLDQEDDEVLRVSSLLSNTSVHDIHALPDLGYITKLRPFVHEFLCQASSMFEMYVYTMGTRAYAEAMVHLLDPTQRFFGSRIISRDDNKGLRFKSLNSILAPASATIILDDTRSVWPGFIPNLIQIDRYHFFKSSTRHFGIKAPSLLGALQDESKTSGSLARTLDLLRKVHHVFFNESDPQKRSAEDNDVRHILCELQSSLLTGCKIVFSKDMYMNVTSSYYTVHLLWQHAEWLGAICSTVLDDSVTHVVACHAGSEEAKWACNHHRHLVHPCWIEATFFTWKRPAETDFAVDATPMLSTFSETTGLLLDDTCNTDLHVDTKPQSSVVGETVHCCG